MVVKEDAEPPGGPKRPQTRPVTFGGGGRTVTVQSPHNYKGVHAGPVWPLAGIRYMSVCIANGILECVQTGASVYSKGLVGNASMPFTSIHDGFLVRKLNPLNATPKV